MYHTQIRTKGDKNVGVLFSQECTPELSSIVKKKTYILVHEIIDNFGRICQNASSPQMLVLEKCANWQCGNYNI